MPLTNFFLVNLKIILKLFLSIEKLSWV